MTGPDKSLPRRARLMAVSVHIFTASGAAFAFLALAAAISRDFVAMFGWLGVAFFVDGIDGSLARAASVKQVTPHMDGEILDLVVDYLTYVLVPMVALWRSGLMPEVAGEVVVLIVLVASGLYFADRRMKTPDQWFRGFPALWNVELLYLFVFRPAAFLCAAITLILAACLFVPIVFVHPLRVRQLRRVTISVTTVWFAAAAVAVTEGFVTSILVKTILVACAIYMLALPLVRKSAPFACTPRNKT